MDFYRITPQELGQEVDQTHAEVGEASPPVRYRHPATGQTWDGRGPHPQWMRQALLQDGYRVDDLRVASHGDDSNE